MEEIGFLFGAASGIGKATYQKIRNTYPELKLIILDKSPVDLLNKKDEFYQLDLSDFENAKKFIKLKINNQKLVVKFIINTIGYQENVTIDNIDYMQWDKMYNATVKSIFFIEREIIKLMKLTPINNQSIVNVTSIHTEIIRDIVHYSSSKSAIKMISKELAYQLASCNIRVNCVEPGSIDTPLLRKDLNNNELINEAAMNIPMKRHGKPDEVADLILFLISDHAKYITGESIVIDGGLSLII